MKFLHVKRLLAAVLAGCLLTGCTLTERIGTGNGSDEQHEIMDEHEAGYFGLAYYTGEKVNPVLSTSHINRVLTEALYEGMFYLDSKFQPQPMLCESWEGDGTTFTFRLKQGVTFWSGEELTADDVVYSLRAAKANEASPYYSRMADVKSIFADDTYTVGVVLRTPNMDFPRLMDIPIFREGTEEETFADGTGAYQPIHDEGAWYLAPYTGWHGGSVGTFERIDLVNTTRSDAVAHAFETGDVSLTRVERIGTNPVTISGSVDLHQTPTTNLHYLGFGCAAGPFSLPEVRKAVSLLIARENICSTTFQSFADPAVLPVNPQPDSVETSAESDREAAAAALAQAGIADTNGDGVLDYDNGVGGRTDLRPVIVVNSENSFKTAAAQQIADTLLTAGIPATVEAVPFEDYIARLSGGMFDLYYGEVKMSPDFDLRALIGAAGAMNYGKYSNQDTDWLIQQMRAAGTEEARETLNTQFLKEMPIAPIAFTRDQVVVRSGLITGFNPSPYWLFHGVAGWRRSS